MESLLVVVLVVALLMAVAMSVFAWRVLRRDRERTDIRVARLRALAAPPAPEPDFQPALIPEHEHRYESGFSNGDLFTASAPAPAGTHWGMTVLVVVVFMTIGAGSAYGLYGSGPKISWPVGAFASVAVSPSPLELVSLSHRREPGGDFVVTGLVRNPVDGRATQGLVAVVYLFDAEGQYFTSGKSPIDVSALAPGDQSPFLIRLSNIAKVSRYRVGFRLGDDGVYAHVDRRGAPLVGTTAAVVEEAR
jgi:hypothetical protein